MSQPTNPPAAVNINNLGARVTTREFSWLDMSIRAWGAEWTAPDHGTYRFSNGREFDSTDQTHTGIY